MRIGVVGYGVVGKAMARFLQGAHETFVYDKFLPGFADHRHLINTCELAFICVPTPTSSAASADLSAVSEAVDWINVPTCIRSTVLPGTTALLIARTGKQIAFSPEYLGEAETHPWRDEPDCGFVIVGGSAAMAQLVFDAYRPLVPEAHQFVHTDPATAELCKYMVNCFLATKVAFANQFFDIAQELGIDFEETRKLWLLDSRIGSSHSAVTCERGFGGRCLPKDLAAIVSLMRENGGAPMLEAVQRYNEQLRKRTSLPTFDRAL